MPDIKVEQVTHSKLKISLVKECTDGIFTSNTEVEDCHMDSAKLTDVAQNQIPILSQ